MLATQKRGRACEACSKIKIKCELGSLTDAAPPCERCVRLGKECTLVAPKRQKDRVAELEAQVERLTRLLRDSGIPDSTQTAILDSTERTDDGQSSTPSSLPTTTSDSSTLRKKRRLDGSVTEPPTDRSDAQDAWASGPISVEDPALRGLDLIIPLPLQARLLDRYLHEMVPHFPLIRPPDSCSLDLLRRQNPLLLQAIAYAACPGILSLDIQEDLARLVLNSLANAAIAEAQKSLELVQALQIVCLWYRMPSHHRRVSVYQLIQLAGGIAVDMGLGGPESSPALGYPLDGAEIESTQAWRAWLTCYLISAAMSTFMRRPNNAPWTYWHEQSALMLDYASTALPADQWLTHYIRAERLCEQIAEQLGFQDLGTCIDVADAEMQRKMRTCQNQIFNWKMLLPDSVQVSTILFWEHVATAYMYEPVLHTTTNKHSFTAPYTVERLSGTDFPTPTVTPEHLKSLMELVSAAHRILDHFVSWDAVTLVALPGFLFASRAAYAIYLLTKAFIAVTGSGNTYGAVYDADNIRLEQRIDELIRISAKVNAIDGSSSPARVLRSAPRIKEWYINYTMALSTNLTSTPQSTLSNLTSSELSGKFPALGNAGLFNADTSAMNFEDLFWLSDGSTDFGLDFLFGEAPMTMDDGLASQSFGKSVTSMPEFITPSVLQSR